MRQNLWLKSQNRKERSVVDESTEWQPSMRSKNINTIKLYTYTYHILNRENNLLLLTLDVNVPPHQILTAFVHSD